MSVHRETLPSSRRAYRVRWRDGDRNRSRSFERRADAEQFDADERRRQRMGAHAPAEPSRDRLDAWLETWVRRDGVAWARSTRLHRAAVMDKWIAPLIGGVRLRDLGRARVREWRAEMLDRGATNATANGAMRVLSAALGVAVQDGLIPANPCLGIRRLSHAPAPARPLSPAESERLRAELPTLRDQVLWGLMAYAGLRPEEALALRWGDVGATLYVHRAFTHGEQKDTKTGRARSVTVIGPLADDLAAWRERSEWSEHGDLVCPSLGRADRPADAARRGGFLHLGNWRNRAFIPATRRARLAGVIPYNGRDTFASLLIYEGRPPILVAAALGHGDTQTLWRHYAGVFAEAEHVTRMPIDEAVRRARAQLRSERNVPTLFPRGPLEGASAAFAEAQKSASAGKTRVRAAGFEPATSGSGGQRSIH
jgi:integrase